MKIRQAAKIVRKNAPELPIGIFIDKYYPELDEDVDIWLVTFPALAELRKSGRHDSERVWLYNSGGMTNFRLPASDIRGYYLFAYRNNIEDFLSSEVNQIGYSGVKNGYFYNFYPQHCLMYVSEDGREVYPSWRWLLMADGLDDYDYIVLFRNLLKERGRELPAWLTDKLPVFDKDGEIEFKINTVAEWNSIRDRIAGEIVKMTNRTLTALPKGD